MGTKMSFIESIKEALPEYAKDTKLNLDAVLLRSTLDADVAMGCAVAALAATGNGKVLAVMLADAPVHSESAMCAASIMAQKNVWYPFVEMADDPALKGLPAQLRMNAIIESRRLLYDCKHTVHLSVERPIHEVFLLGYDQRSSY